MDRLAGKVAIVTGGASGIGEAAVRLFAAEGARVVFADLQDDRAAALAQDVGDRVRYLRTDVSRAAEVAHLVARTVEWFGKLDVIFNNAAVLLDGYRIADHPEDLFDRQMAVNLKGVWLGMKYAIPAMLANGGGSIVNTGSLGGFLGYAGQSGYGASKGGVLELTRHVSTEYAAEQIRVNCICPGATLSQLVFDRRPGTPKEEVEALFAGTNPMGRALQPVDIARVALWLASDESAMVNGAIIPVDGGRSASSYRGPAPRIPAR